MSIRVANEQEKIRSLTNRVKVKPGIQIVTDVSSVSEFLDKYYKPDRYSGRGEEYAKALLQAHESDFQSEGYDTISSHDSMNGSAVIFAKDESKIPSWALA